jgi:dTDP-glucose 4,6-dehydratase
LDHCRAIDLVIKKGTAGETYLIGGLTEDIPNLEVVRKMLKFFDKDESYIQLGKDRAGHDRRYAVDWTKINKELGWKPEFGFDAVLQKTIEWYRDNEWWWKPLKKEAEALYARTGQK